MSGFLLSRQGAIAASDPTRPIPLGAYGEAIMALDPIAYFRFNEWLPTTYGWPAVVIKDEVGNHSSSDAYSVGGPPFYFHQSYGAQPPLVGNGYAALARYVGSAYGPIHIRGVSPADDFQPESHGGKITFCWWRKGDASGVDHTIVYGPGFQIINSASSNSVSCRVTRPEGFDAYLGSPAEVDTDDGATHFYAVTLDYAGWARLYVDGLLKAAGGSIYIPTDLATASSGTVTGLSFIDGIYDEVSIFGDVLTELQIQDLYAIGTP